MITLIFGPMYSGKTNMLLEQERIFQAGGRRVLIVKYKNDTRYSNDAKIVSHSKETNQPTTKVILADTLCSEMILELAKEFQAVLIDEGQFFKDCPQFLKLMRKEKKHVLVSGLSGDYKQEMFATMSSIIPLCDKIVHLNSACSFCDSIQAAFTIRTTTQTEQELIGGIEMYKPCCGGCLSKF